MGTQDVKIRVMTWNAGDEKPPHDLSAFLGLDKPDDQDADIIAVGLQEIIDDEAWFKFILEQYKARDYFRVKTRTMNAITAQVYVKRRHLRQVTNVESEVTKTGFGGMMGNKGGVSVRLDFYGINFIFVNAHFQAHVQNYADRIEDFNDIISTQHFRDDSVEVILDHDYVFWTGDLNFRIDDLDKAEIERRIEGNDSKSLWPHDQLHKGMEEKFLFVDFEEGDLNFPPTFKFDKGTQDYDTSKKARKPAWTDRILWMVHEDSFKGVTLGCELDTYSSIQEYTHSDHKPVYAEFKIKILETGIPMPVYFFRVDNSKQSWKVKFAYKLDAKMELSTQDWIAMYRKDFMTYADYGAWTYVKPVKIGEKTELELDHGMSHGTFFLAFFSKNKNCLIGYSNDFHIKKSAKASGGKCMVL